MATSIKLPPFYPQNAKFWFTQADAQFHLRGITSSQTKYFHLISSLQYESAQMVMNLIETEPPGDDPYGALKEALLAVYIPSDYQIAEAIINLPALGDQKPTVLLAKIKALLPTQHPPKCLFVRHAFLSRLPASIRTILLKEDSPLDVLASSADMLLSAFPTNTGISSAFAQPQQPPDETVGAVYRQGNRRAKPRSPTATAGQQPLCWYHARFGKNATKCRHSDETPCALRSAVASPPSGNASGGRRN